MHVLKALDWVMLSLLSARHLFQAASVRWPIEGNSEKWHDQRFLICSPCFKIKIRLFYSFIHTVISLQINWHLWDSRALFSLTGSILRWAPTEPRSIRSYLSLWFAWWSYETQAGGGGKPRDYVACRYWLTNSSPEKCTDTHLYIRTLTHCQHDRDSASSQWSRIRWWHLKNDWCVEKGEPLLEG